MLGSPGPPRLPSASRVAVNCQLLWRHSEAKAWWRNEYCFICQSLTKIWWIWSAVIIFRSVATAQKCGIGWGAVHSIYSFCAVLVKGGNCQCSWNRSMSCHLRHCMAAGFWVRHVLNAESWYHMLTQKLTSWTHMAAPIFSIACKWLCQVFMSGNDAFW